MKRLLVSVLSGAALAASVSAAEAAKASVADGSWIGKAGYPLITFRLTGSPTQRPEFFKKTCELFAKHPGACDEVWFGGGAAFCKFDVCQRAMDKMAALAPYVKKAGVIVSYQQGLTLGHNYLYKGEPGTQAAAGVYRDEDVFPFPDDAWMVTSKGEKTAWKNLCPRAKASQDYLREYVRRLCATLHPYTYWLDDDLRLAVGKDGCYCDRCLKAFNAKNGTDFTREQLVARLAENGRPDPIRLKWIEFNEESLALFGRAAREGANAVQPDCRLALQTVTSTAVLNGRDYGPILRELSDGGRVPSGTRPGHGSYREDRPRDFLVKAIWCAREAEKCRRLGRLCGTVSYEEETYTRRVFHKSPNAIVNECALAMAAGCDALSLYWADGEKPEERLEDYERFVKAIARARPYFERLSASVKRTSLGGVVRYLGSKTYETWFSTDEDTDAMLMQAGIPVTVAESSAAHRAWYVTDRSRAAMAGDGELAQVEKEGLVDFGTVTGVPYVAQRLAWLDELDRVTKGRFPVRVDLPHAQCILPRVDRDGKTDSVTFFNVSMGDTDEFVAKIRNPRGLKPVLSEPGKKDVEARCAYDAAKDELTVTIPNVPGYHPLTVFL